MRERRIIERILYSFYSQRFKISVSPKRFSFPVSAELQTDIYDFRQSMGDDKGFYTSCSSTRKTDHFWWKQERFLLVGFWRPNDWTLAAWNWSLELFYYIKKQMAAECKLTLLLNGLVYEWETALLKRNIRRHTWNVFLWYIVASKFLVFNFTTDEFDIV